MKKLVILLTLALLFVAHQAEAKKIALLIGVGKYPAMSGWCGLDASEDVEMLQQSLKGAGFAVFTLTDASAKHDNILKAIENLKCQPGDMVLIHFSGHGQQMVDAMGDEKDHRTEAFIPYDAKIMPGNGYKGDNHLTDDEIRDALIPVRNKLGAKGHLMVTFDACHSADGSRGGDDDLVARGTDYVFKPGKRVATRNKKSKYAADEIEVSACNSDQTNKQYKYKPGKQCGSLSFLLNEGIKMQGKSINFIKLAKYITAEKNYRRVMPTTQTPRYQIIK